MNGIKINVAKAGSSARNMATTTGQMEHHRKSIEECHAERIADARRKLVIAIREGHNGYVRIERLQGVLAVLGGGK